MLPAPFETTVRKKLPLSGTQTGFRVVGASPNEVSLHEPETEAVTLAPTHTRLNIARLGIRVVSYIRGIMKPRPWPGVVFFSFTSSHQSLLSAAFFGN